MLNNRTIQIASKRLIRKDEEEEEEKNTRENQDRNRIANPAAARTTKPHTQRAREQLKSSSTSRARAIALQRATEGEPRKIQTITQKPEPYLPAPCIPDSQ